jgi:hypothetical protein
MPYRTVRELEPTEAAYLAGLIDGEGTITLSRRHARDGRQLVVSISSTEPSILDWVIARIGAGKITRKRVVSSRHAAGLTYSISNRQALAVLAQTVEHLQSYKRRRAELVLRKYVELTPRNGKYSSELAAARADFEAKLLRISANTHKAHRAGRPAA